MKIGVFVNIYFFRKGFYDANSKTILQELGDCRDEKEALAKLKSFGIDVSADELKRMKLYFEQKVSKDSSSLCLEQLDKVVGGMKSRKQSESAREEDHRVDNGKLVS